MANVPLSFSLVLYTVRGEKLFVVLFTPLGATRSSESPVSLRSLEPLVHFGSAMFTSMELFGHASLTKHIEVQLRVR